MDKLFCLYFSCYYALYICRLRPTHSKQISICGSSSVNDALKMFSFKNVYIKK